MEKRAGIQLKLADITLPKGASPQMVRRYTTLSEIRNLLLRLINTLWVVCLKLHRSPLEDQSLHVSETAQTLKSTVEYLILAAEDLKP